MKGKSVKLLKPLRTDFPVAPDAPWKCNPANAGLDAIESASKEAAPRKNRRVCNYGLQAAILMFCGPAGVPFHVMVDVVDPECAVSMPDSISKVLPAMLLSEPAEMLKLVPDAPEPAPPDAAPTITEPPPAGTVTVPAIVAVALVCTVVIAPPEGMTLFDPTMLFTEIPQRSIAAGKVTAIVAVVPEATFKA